MRPSAAPRSRTTSSAAGPGPVQPTGTESARDGRVAAGTGRAGVRVRRGSGIARAGPIRDDEFRTARPASRSASPSRRGRDARLPVGFLLLVLLNAVLFVRPSEIVPGLEVIPIYNILITSCLLASFPVVGRELTSGSLARTPISVCVVGLLPAVMLSHLSHANLTMTKDAGVEFGKVVLYYLLLVGLLDRIARLRRFMACAGRHDRDREPALAAPLLRGDHDRVDEGARAGRGNVGRRCHQRPPALRDRDLLGPQRPLPDPHPGHRAEPVPARPARLGRSAGSGWCRWGCSSIRCF